MKERKGRKKCKDGLRKKKERIIGVITRNEDLGERRERGTEEKNEMEIK